MSMQAQKVKELVAEIAALKEPMACGHPAACWIPPKDHGADVFANIFDSGGCTACEHERLAVATALRGAARFQRQQCKCFDGIDDQSPCGQCYRCWAAQEIESQIPHADHKALDAYVQERVVELAVTPKLVEDIHAAVAQGWCVQPNTRKTVDVELGLAITNNVLTVLRERAANRDKVKP